MRITMLANCRGGGRSLAEGETYDDLPHEVAQELVRIGRAVEAQEIATDDRKKAPKDGRRDG